MSDEQDLENIGEENELNEEIQDGNLEDSQDEPKDDEIDPRYRGKDVKDIIRMHQEAEKLIARQSQEVGEVRRLADELIKSQLHPKTEEEKSEVDFFDNPNEAVRRAIESSPDVKQAKEYALLARQDQAKRELLTKHPDAYELVQNPEFLDWIKQSKVRTELAVRADKNYDVDAADELYTTYKAIKGTAKKVDATEKANRDKTLKAAAVDTGGSGESSKKVYRRADLIQLRLTKPQEFYARQQEFDQAYLEGRVR